MPMRKLIVAAFVVVLLAGCASKETQPEAPVDDKSAAATTPSTGATTAPAGGAGVSGTAAGTRPGVNPLRDPSNVLSKRSVYFDYDSDVVKEEYKVVVDAHARYLVVNRSLKIMIQGHADERGSREYNIALGQRRADAVKRMMLLLGAQDVQIETVSFGEEKPRNTGHDDAAWSENRRGDIQYPGE